MSASGTKTKKTIPPEENQLTNDQLANDQAVIEQVMQYEKRIYDLGQMLDIAKSFCSTLDFSKLLESIVYICMAQMHVLGTEIFVRDLITNEVLKLETSKDNFEKPLEISKISCNFATDRIGGALGFLLIYYTKQEKSDHPRSARIYDR